MAFVADHGKRCQIFNRQICVLLTLPLVISGMVL